MGFSSFVEKIDRFCDYPQPWETRKDYVPLGEFGVEPDKRPISEMISSSIINVDKPPGPTSHEVAFWVKTMFGLPRVGHGGTLELMGGAIPRLRVYSQ
ncbi:hypothetical protein [Metallosphaera hakonensis]|uniref:hypothetical protein n=1 Tax=Metallosphaera hakonensis TaxID=79601 RepID=UPI0006D06B38|nr:hypothetical protein [Metallosphaera hakonensis]